MTAVHLTSETEAAMPVDVDTDAAIESDYQVEVGDAAGGRGPRWARVLIFGVAPALALVLALGVGYLKWQTGSAQQNRAAAAQSVAAATETTIAILGYRTDTVEQDLHAATGRLTGTFRDDYLKLIDDVVIPGATDKRVSTKVTVPAAASLSADAHRAEVLVFVNQETTFGTETPSNSVSSVKVTLEKDNDRWLVSQFEPV